MVFFTITVIFNAVIKNRYYPAALA